MDNPQALRWQFYGNLDVPFHLASFQQDVKVQICKNLPKLVFFLVSLKTALSAHRTPKLGTNPSNSKCFVPKTGLRSYTGEGCVHTSEIECIPTLHLDHSGKMYSLPDLYTRSTTAHLDGWQPHDLLNPLIAHASRVGSVLCMQILHNLPHQQVRN